MKKPPDIKISIKNQGDETEANDGALFRASVGAVHPLPEHNRIPPFTASRYSKVRSSAPQQTIADTLSDFPFDHSPEFFLRNGLSQMTLRKLKRGNYPVQDSLDLHGYPGDAARQRLQEFLHEATQRKLRCVLVIHGKGINSRGGAAVLRGLTRNWLTQHPQVLAFCAASPQAGGNGAVVVLLKISNRENHSP